MVISHTNRWGDAGVALMITEAISVKQRPDLQMSCLDTAETVLVENEFNSCRYITGPISLIIQLRYWTGFPGLDTRIISWVTTANLLKYPSKSQVVELVHTCALFLFLLVVSKPTWVTTNTISCIDNIFTNNLAYLLSAKTAIVDTSISNGFLIPHSLDRSMSRAKVIYGLIVSSLHQFYFIP